MRNLFDYRRQIGSVLIASFMVFLPAGCSSVPVASDVAAGSKDTKAPVITLKSDEVSVKPNEKLDAASTVESVKDDTDGSLKEVKELKDGEAGYTVDSSKVDLTKEGTYKVIVTAVDSTGNKTTKTVTVKVAKDVSDKADTSKDSSKEDSKKEEKDSAKMQESKTDTSEAKGKGKAVVTDGSSSSSKGASASSNKTASSGNSNSSKPASSSSSKPAASKPATSVSCNHDWKPITKKVTITDKDAYDEQVQVKAAWDEQVQTKAAWDEQVCVQEAYDEPIYEWRSVNVCKTCGATEDQFANFDEFGAHLMSAHQYPSRYYAKEWQEQVGTQHHDAVYQTVHHDAEYQTIHHDAEYKTVHHDAVTHTEEQVTGYKCSKCGATK